MKLLRALLLSSVVLSTGCARQYLDPNAGQETVLVRTMHHSELLNVQYLRTAEQGPLRYEGNSWTLFWVVPLNRPDMSAWLDEALPPEASAANVRASLKTPWYGHLVFFCSLTLARVDRVRFEADPVRLLPAGDYGAGARSAPRPHSALDGSNRKSTTE